MNNIVKTPDDDNKGIVGLSDIYTISTVEHSRGGANDDDKSVVHHPLNNASNLNTFIPSLKPLTKCSRELTKNIYDGLTEIERKILHYYKEGVSQLEVANKIGISIASHGRHLKAAKLKFRIKTKNAREAITILHLVFGFRLPEKVLADVSYWSNKYYGFDSEIANVLRDERMAIFRKRAEEKRRLAALQNQPKNGTTN